MLHCGQCHSDRQPFMASPCTESSLPTPHRGSRRVANANHGRQHKGTAKIANTNGATCLSLGWWWWWWGEGGEEGGGPGSWPCSSSRAPTPRPWRSSVLVRSGAFSLPGPMRRSSAHVSAVSGAVAAVVAVQLQNRAAR